MNDSLYKILADISRVLETLQKNSRNAKRKKEIMDKTNLQNAIRGCIQNLEKCKISLVRNAYIQAGAVRDDMLKGADTVPQKQILWDSAMGYLIADEAISALRTVAGHDDLNRAYAVMENIIRRVNNDDEEEKVPGIGKIGLAGRIRKSVDEDDDGKGLEIGKSRKDGFGVKHVLTADLTSKERLQRHEAMVNSFFVELIRTGDLQRLIEEAREKAFSKSLDELYALQETSDVEEIDEPDTAETIAEPDIAEVDDEPDLAEIDDEPDLAEPVVKAKPKSASGMFSKPNLGGSRKG